jgi:transcription elongation factor SPT6
LAKKFGLTPEQFGENLRDNYQRHEAEQESTEPMEVAEEYISKYGPLCICYLSIGNVILSCNLFS